MPGYDQPQPPKDGWAAKLYKKHGLGENPTMQQIEPKATQLLGNLQTALEGTELILARRVDANEAFIAQIIFSSATPQEKFALLLMQKGLVEES